MIDQEQLTDEYLNAFVDGQLTPEEELRVMWLINQDVDQRRRVCLFRWISDLLRLAYEDTQEYG
jgi:anti-sigma factor RsiW